MNRIIAQLLISIVAVQCQNYSDVDWISLVEKTIFSGYSHTTSPYSRGQNSSRTGEVRINLIYARLATVDEQALEHSNILGLYLSWVDPRLRWDPSKFGGIDHLYIRLCQVWVPEAQFCESTSVTYLAPRYAQFVRIFSTGVIDMQKYMDVTFACNFETFRFPFDVQYCTYCLTLPFYTSHELVLKTTIDDEIYVQDTSEFSLQLVGMSNSSIHSSESDFFYFNIIMTRRPVFWITLVIVPTFLLVTVVLLGLFFGSVHEPIENVSLGLATMMSMTVNVGILNESLAKSETLPVIGWFVLWEIALITGAVIAVMIVDMTKKKFYSYRRRGAPISNGVTIMDTHKDYDSKKIIDRFIKIRFSLFILFTILHTINLAFLLGNAVVL